MRLARVSSQVEIVVSDTGPGIPAQSLPHIFDRFRQVDSSSTRQHAGLGIGLAVVRHLVELHGGTVEASSGEGGGATFTVRLPLLPAHAVAPVAQHPAAGGRATALGASLLGMRMLLVDDEADTLEVFSTVLITRGAEIRTASSAREALEIVGTWTPDLLVSDIGMPGMDGYALIRTIRDMQAAGLPRIAAIAVTAYGRVEDRIRILDAGFQMHITSRWILPSWSPHSRASGRARRYEVSDGRDAGIRESRWRADHERRPMRDGVGAVRGRKTLK